MKARKLFIMALVSIAILLSASLLSSQNKDNKANCNCKFYDNLFDEKSCTSMGVGKKATIDGSTIISQSADCGVCDFRILLEPAADHPPGTMRMLWHLPQGSKGLTIDDVKESTGIEIPQPKHTYKYFKAIFGLMNEHQLAVAEATIGGRTELRNRKGLFDVTELSMLAMERCKTAREAIKLMGELAEKYGVYVGGEQLVVADGEEVWDFEVHGVGQEWEPDSDKPGAVWAAQRVPDDCFFICNNMSRIKEIDLNDTDNFMASKHVISLAEEKGYWSKESGEPFRFDKAYTDYTPLRIKWDRRVYAAYRLVAPSQNFDPDETDFPFAIKPDRKLSVADIMALYRDHYQDTKFDQTKGLATGPFANPDRPRIDRTKEEEVEAINYIRQIPVVNCDYTVINQSRKWLPDDIGGIVWWGADCPDTTVFVPFYIGINELPQSYTVGHHKEFGREYAWWAFSFVNNWAHLVYSHMIEDIKEEQKRLEDKEFQTLPESDKKALELYGQNKENAKEFLTQFCLDNANKVVEDWWRLADQLIVKYNDGGRVKPSEDWIKALQRAQEK
jgi:dipeptidase